MSPARKTRRKKKAATPPPKAATPLDVAIGERSQRLGSKHACYACGAKFYDLNKPEPVCPKCGANQTERPKEGAKSSSPSEPRRRGRGRGHDMSPLLDDEDEQEAPREAAAEEVDLEAGPARESLFDDVPATADDED